MRELKPHLAYDAQLSRLTGRGMSYQDRRLALGALKRVGYYRLSAYAYPFRLPPEVEGDPGRSDQFAPGTTFEDVMKLYNFDEKLRSVLLSGLEVVEVGVAVKVGYILGKRGPLAHLDISALDETECKRLSTDGVGQIREAHDIWASRFDKLKQDALAEEYVKHHVIHYGGDMPIWAATGFMDFGALLRLLQLMKPGDRMAISDQLRLTNDRSDLLIRWLKALNILRNHCAHHNRVWNRSSVDVPPKFSTRVVPDTLHHLNEIDSAKRLKLYQLVALIAHLSVAIDPQSNWPRTFATTAKKLGTVNGMTLENVMGFPAGWQNLPLWNYEPVRVS